MKKRILTTTMALAMAFTTAMSGMGTLTAHAYTDDGAYHGDDMADGGSSASDGSDDIGGGNGGSSNSSSSSSGNNSGSTDDGAYHGDGMANGGSSASNGNDDIGSGNGGSSATASYTAPKAAGKVLTCKLDASAPCRLDAPDIDVARWGSTDCLHQHQQVI